MLLFRKVIYRSKLIQIAIKFSLDLNKLSSRHFFKKHNSYQEGGHLEKMLHITAMQEIKL